MGRQGPIVSTCRQQRLIRLRCWAGWSESCCKHRIFVGFVMLLLNSFTTRKLEKGKDDYLKHVEMNYQSLNLSKTETNDSVAFPLLKTEFETEFENYRNFLKFSDRQVRANSADPDQRNSLIRVYTVCHSVCTVWTHYSMVEPHSSNFRVITTNVLGVRIFRKFTVHVLSVLQYIEHYKAIKTKAA